MKKSTRVRCMDNIGQIRNDAVGPNRRNDDQGDEPEKEFKHG